MSNYYVNKSGSDGNSGASHAAAKLTIGGAVSVASTNDTIYVGTGVYEELVLIADKGLILQADGYVVISGSGIRAYCIHMTENAAARSHSIIGFVLEGATSAGLYIQPSGAGYFYTLTIRDNIFRNCYYGFQTSTFNNPFLCNLFNNLFYDCTEGILYTFNATTTAVLNARNNTFADCTVGFHRSWDSSVFLYNNIISNCVKLLDFDLSTNVTSDYNLLYFDGTATADWVGTTGITSLATWRSTSSKDANSTSADPLFSDRAKDSYTLQSASTGFTGGNVFAGYSEQRGAFTRLVTAISSNRNPTLISGGVFVSTSQDGSGNVQLDTGSSGTFATDVINFGVSRNVRKVHLKSSETYPASVIDNSAADTAPNRKKYEYRYSDTAFLKGDASPSWNTIEIDQDIAVSARYWQFRFTLRTNGVAA